MPAGPITGRPPRFGRARRELFLAFALAVLLTLCGSTVARAGELAYACEEDICTIDASNPETHADLTKTPSNDDLHPAWSPDGTRIAFNGDYTGDGDVYVLSPSVPENATDISNSPSTSDGIPVWSADGTELAWISGTNSGDVYVDFGAADGKTTPQQIAATPEGGHVQDQEPAWSPTGARLAFARHNSIFLASPNKSTLASALKNGLGGDPAWSPNGARIAAITASEPHRVRLIDADGDGIATELPVSASLYSDVRWSPDGSHVVYVDANDQIRVAPTDPVGEGFTIQLPAGLRAPREPSFSPDGTQIAFESYDIDQSPSYERIYLAPAAGGEAVELTKAPQNSEEPVWKPGPLGPPAPGGGSGSSGGGSTGSGSGSAAGGGTPGGRPATHAPVTITFASYRHPYISGGFMGAAYIDCSLGASTAAVCHANGEATYVQPAGLSRPLSGRSRPKAQAVVFAKGAVTVPDGQAKKLRLKITPAGRQLLKPGRKLKLALTVVESAPGAKSKKTTRMVTVTAPKKK